MPQHRPEGLHLRVFNEACFYLFYLSGDLLRTCRNGSYLSMRGTLTIPDSVTRVAIVPILCRGVTDLRTVRNHRIPVNDRPADLDMADDGAF